MFSGKIGLPKKGRLDVLELKKQMYAIHHATFQAKI